MPISDPTGITGCQMWLKRGEWYTDAGVTKVSTAGDQVQRWSDLSGNGRHATQTTASKKPTYVPNTWKSTDGIRFTRSSSQELQIDLGWMFNSPVTLVIISRRRSQPGTYYYCGSATGGTSGGSLHTGYRDNTTLTEALWGNDVNVTVNGYNSNREDWKRHTFWWGGTSGGSAVTRAVYAWGLALFTTTSDTSKLNSSANATNSRIGQAVGNYFDGELFEVIGYNKILSSTELSDLWDWLTNTQGYTPDQSAAVTALGASVLALDVATPVPKLRLTAHGVSVLALDITFPPSGVLMTALGASVLACDVASPPSGRPVAWAYVIA